MGKIYRYKFAKKYFKNTLVIILEKGKYKSVGIDGDILNYIGFKNLEKERINYLVLDNLAIVSKKEFLDNRYQIIYIKVKLKKIFEGRKKEILGQL